MDKKLKAAITAVLYYLEEENNSGESTEKISKWAIAARKNIMQNRNFVQRRGKLFDLRRK